MRVQLSFAIRSTQDGVLKQVDLVRANIGDEVPVTGILCFTGPDWPLIGRAFTIRGVDVLEPRTLYLSLTAAGSFESEVPELRRSLASTLPTAGPFDMWWRGSASVIGVHTGVRGSGLRGSWNRSDRRT